MSYYHAMTLVDVNALKYQILCLMQQWHLPRKAIIDGFIYAAS